MLEVSEVFNISDALFTYINKIIYEIPGKILITKTINKLSCSKYPVTYMRTILFDTHTTEYFENLLNSWGFIVSINDYINIVVFDVNYISIFNLRNITNDVLVDKVIDNIYNESIMINKQTEIDNIFTSNRNISLQQSFLEIINNIIRHNVISIFCSHITNENHYFYDNAFNDIIDYIKSLLIEKIEDGFIHHIKKLKENNEIYINIDIHTRMDDDIIAKKMIEWIKYIYSDDTITMTYIISGSRINVYKNIYVNLDDILQ
jgi:hypothetical protein